MQLIHPITRTHWEKTHEISRPQPSLEEIYRQNDGLGGYSNNYNPYQSANYNSGGPQDGGGFMNNNATSNPFESPGNASPGSGGKVTTSLIISLTKQRSSGNTTRVVTIKQILEASQIHPDAEFRIDNAEIGYVTFVGQIRNVAMASTNVTYRIEDGTGLIEVKQWLDSDTTDLDRRNELSNDMYVRVVGQLKSFSGKRHVGSHHIRRITDMNEVHYHFLEATTIHLYFTRGPIDGTHPKHESSSMMMQGIQNTGASQGYNNNAGIEQKIAEHKLPPYHAQIMRVIMNQPASNEGVPMNIIAQNVKGGDLRVAVEELLQDGLLYTTI
ncbi:Replication factor A protein 2, partial [Neolecta irregularis DAH-3]